MGVILRIRLTIFFIAFTFLFALAQKSKTIVDDTTKVIYGTNTTYYFTTETVFKENRVFFKKDTMYTNKITKIKPDFSLVFKKPTLYTKEELLQKSIDDTTAKRLKEKQILINDTTTYFKKDTSGSTLKKIGRFFKKKPQKPLPFESRFFKNEYLYSKLDTTIDKLQQYNMNYINDNIYQNLGLIGTPSKPVFLTQPQQLGYQTGFNIYNVYYTDPSKVRYYNTRSPFTNVYYVGNPGITGEDRIKFDINRNIARNWNLGFSYERIFTNKLIGQTGRSSRSLALGQEFIFYTSTKSRNGRYHFMANANYFLFFNNEQGGLKKINDQNLSSEQAVLDDAQVPANFSGWPVELNATNYGINASSTRNKIFSRDRRVSYYMYHQYDVLRAGKLAVFYEFDRRNQRYTFSDPFPLLPKEGEVNFYKGSYKRSLETFFNQEFAFVTNKAGIKSNLDKLVFGAYLKNRNVMGSNKLTVPMADDVLGNPLRTLVNWLDDPKANIRLNENYIGGFLKGNLTDSIRFEANGEWMLSMTNRSNNQDILDSLVVGSRKVIRTNDTITVTDTTKVYQSGPYQKYKYKGDYNLDFKVFVYNFEAGINFTRQSPALINYYSLQHNMYHWYQDLNPSITNSIYAKYHYQHKNFYFDIKPSLFQLSNYVYFNENIRPTQTDDKKQLYYAFLDLTFNTHLGPMHFDTKFKYTFSPDDQPKVIRMPTFFINPRIYFKIVPKSKVNKQDFRIGFDIYYRSSYFGDVYMPSVGQFYVQNSANDRTTNFKMSENVMVDFFITAKLRNAKVFLKFNQINQLAGLTRGYYISPYYPAINGTFQFGLNWLLFD